MEALRVQRVQAMTIANRKSIALMEKEKQAKIIVIHGFKESLKLNQSQKQWTAWNLMEKITPESSKYGNCLDIETVNPRTGADMPVAFVHMGN
eukprot:1989445-Karenia_brevis.AAC.1